MSDVEHAVRERLYAVHADVVEGTSACADEVAAGWDGAWTTDRQSVVDPLTARLDGRGLTDRYPAVLADLVTAAGYDLAAPPVAAPPYVVVTSTGPLLRATVADGRLRVWFRVFAIERGEHTRYVRRDSSPASVVEVSFVQSTALG